MILGKHIGSICIIWTVFGIYDIPTQLWVSRDLDKQGNKNTNPDWNATFSYNHPASDNTNVTDSQTVDLKLWVMALSGWPNYVSSQHRPFLLRH